MTLGDLIAWLEAQVQDAIIPHGFSDGHSYRGIYDELAFEPAENTVISEMLKFAKMANGTLYGGWKGGEYKMDEYTECWIAEYGYSEGTRIGPTLISMWEWSLKNS